MDLQPSYDRDRLAVRRTHAEFVEAAAKMGHQFRLAGLLSAECTCKHASLPGYGGSAKVWRAFRKHAVAVVRMKELDERLRLRDDRVVRKRRHERKRLASIPRAGATIRQLSMHWGVSWNAAREWVLRRVRTGSLSLDLSVTPRLVTRPKEKA